MRSLVVFTIILFSSSAFCQNLVSYFNPKIKGMPHGLQLTYDNEGNLIVYGSFDFVNSEPTSNIVKLNSAGTPIASFNKVISDGVIYDVEVISSGKLMVMGSFAKVNNTNTKNLIRLNSDGSLDPTFTSELGNIRKFAVQSDGKIIVTGNFAAYKGYNSVARLNIDGSLDETFDKVQYMTVELLAVGPDNAIYVSDGIVIRKMDMNGVHQPAFVHGNGVGSTGLLTSLIVTSTNKILAGGNFSQYDGAINNGLVQLNSDGTINLQFNVGIGTTGQPFCIVERSDHNILVAGQFQTFNNLPASIVELNQDGSQKRVIGSVYTNWITGLVESSSHQITASGEFETVNGANVDHIVQFNSDYTINAGFHPDFSYNEYSSRLTGVTSDGKVIAAGGYQIYGIYDGATAIRNRLVRLNTLGAYDETFTSSLSPTTQFNSLMIQSDGKIVITGFLGNTVPMGRLNASGSIDNSFIIGTGPTRGGSGILAGKIKEKNTSLFVAGAFDAFNGVASYGIVCLNFNGSVKTAFTDIPATSEVWNFEFQSDGKIILAGFFPFPTGTKNIIRLNTNGSLDNAFNSQSISGYVNTIAIDPQDRIYIGGNISNVSGAVVNNIARLTSGGALDNSFSTGIGISAENAVAAIVVLPDGNIAIGGYFILFGNQEVNGFVVVSSSGSMINTPNVAFGSTTKISDLHYFNSALYVIGRLTDYDRSNVYGIAKISFQQVPLPEAPSSLVVTSPSEGTFKPQWADNASNEVGFYIERSVASSSGFKVIHTALANQTAWEDKNVLPEITYYYRVKAFNDTGASLYSNTSSFTWHPKPSSPFELTIKQDKLDELILSWKENSSNELGFIVERSSDNMNFIKIDSVAANVTSYTDKVQSNKTYYYKIAAYNDGGNSGYSNVVSFTSLFVPAKPEQLTVQFYDATKKMMLKWIDKSSNEDGFIVEKATAVGGSFTEVTRVSANQNEFTDPSATQATQQVYRVKAYNKVGESEYSNTASVEIIMGLANDALELGVYPVPASQVVYVQVDDRRAADGVWHIVSAAGEVSEASAERLNGLTVLDVKNLTPGLYIVKFRDRNNRVWSGKIIIK